VSAICVRFRPPATLPKMASPRIPCLDCLATLHPLLPAIIPSCMCTLHHALISLSQQAGSGLSRLAAPVWPCKCGLSCSKGPLPACDKRYSVVTRTRVPLHVGVASGVAGVCAATPQPRRGRSPASSVCKLRLWPCKCNDASAVSSQGLCRPARGANQAGGFGCGPLPGSPRCMLGAIAHTHCWPPVSLCMQHPEHSPRALLARVYSGHSPCADSAVQTVSTHAAVTSTCTRQAWDGMPATRRVSSAAGLPGASAFILHNGVNHVWRRDPPLLYCGGKATYPTRFPRLLACQDGSSFLLRCQHC
jgi:hypothetical protein